MFGIFKKLFAKKESKAVSGKEQRTAVNQKASVTTNVESSKRK